jgi:hypothetical protein
MFILVVSKPIIPKASMLESEQINDEIMWIHFSLLSFIISNSHPHCGFKSNPFGRSA